MNISYYFSIRIVMKKIHKTLISLIPVVAMFGIVASPVVAFAEGDEKGACDNTSIIKCSGSGQEAIIDVLKQVIKILTVGVGILAAGAVVVGGIIYATASGEPAKLQTAKTIWTNTVIGLIMYAFLYGFTNFLIPGGVFD